MRDVMSDHKQPNLAHYVIVRDDLPAGVVAAMIVHAAGESAAKFNNDDDGRFRGATAIVLSVPGLLELGALSDTLKVNHIQRVEVSESSAPYTGQLMAVGVVPADRSKIQQFFTGIKVWQPPTPEPLPPQRVEFVDNKQSWV
jgi:hypothetical protein